MADIGYVPEDLAPWVDVVGGQRRLVDADVHEQAGSTHTLVVPHDNDTATEVLFVIHGANLILDDNDRVVRINDAATFRDRYFRLCAEQGLRAPAFET